MPFLITILKQTLNTTTCAAGFSYGPLEGFPAVHFVSWVNFGARMQVNNTFSLKKSWGTALGATDCKPDFTGHPS